MCVCWLVNGQWSLTHWHFHILSQFCFHWPQHFSGGEMQRWGEWGGWLPQWWIAHYQPNCNDNFCFCFECLVIFILVWGAHWGWWGQSIKMPLPCSSSARCSTQFPGNKFCHKVWVHFTGLWWNAPLVLSEERIEMRGWMSLACLHFPWSWRVDHWGYLSHNRTMWQEGGGISREMHLLL